MNKNILKGLSIAGVIIGCIALLISMIPCIGSNALFPALIGLIFSIFSFYKLRVLKEKHTLALLGLILCGLASIVAIIQYFNNKNMLNSAFKTVEHKIEKKVTHVLIDSLKSKIKNRFRTDSVKDKHLNREK